MPCFDFFSKENGEHHSSECMTLTEAKLKAKRLKLKVELCPIRMDNVPME